jgi:hypothetical protein
MCVHMCVYTYILMCVYIYMRVEYNHVLEMFRIKDPDAAETTRQKVFRVLEGGYRLEVGVV